MYNTRDIMGDDNMWLIVIGVIVLLLISFVISKYNKLVKASNRVKNAWAQIDVQLQKRFDLVPNLLKTVKAAAKYESETLEKIVQARNTYNSTSSIEEKININKEAEGLFKSVQFLQENYPELKANSNYTNFMNSLTTIEEQISVSRMFYNDTVNIYNDTIMMFPNNIVAGVFSFSEKPLIEVAQNVRDNVEVEF